MKKIIILSAIITLLFTTDVYAETDKLYDIPLEGSMQYYIVDMCELNRLSPELVFAIIEVESQYQEQVVDASGNCIGLMQINKKSSGELQKKMGCENLYEGYDNVTVGMKMLKDLFEKYGDVERVLLAYNGGEDYMLKMTARGIYSTSYTRKIMKAQEQMYERKQ